MFQTHELANTPPYEAKLRAPPLLIHHTHIHYLHHLLEHYCCNTFLFFFFFLCFFFFYGTPYLHLSMNMYPICGSSCGLKKWKQNEVSLFFFFPPPPISLQDHPQVPELIIYSAGHWWARVMGTLCFNLSTLSPPNLKKKAGIEDQFLPACHKPTTFRAQLLMGLFTTIATLELPLCFFLLVFVISSHFTLDI